MNPKELYEKHADWLLRELGEADSVNDGLLYWDHSDAYVGGYDLQIEVENHRGVPWVKVTLNTDGMTTSLAGSPSELKGMVSRALACRNTLSVKAYMPHRDASDAVQSYLDGKASLGYAKALVDVLATYPSADDEVARMRTMLHFMGEPSSTEHEEAVDALRLLSREDAVRAFREAHGPPPGEDGAEPPGCPTPGACSCAQLSELAESEMRAAARYSGALHAIAETVGVPLPGDSAELDGNACMAITAAVGVLALGASKPPLCEGIQSESGDCDVFCSLCHEMRDEPHTWEECARRMAPLAEAGVGADCERQQMGKLLALIMQQCDGSTKAGSLVQMLIEQHSPKLPELSEREAAAMVSMVYE